MAHTRQHQILHNHALDFRREFTPIAAAMISGSAHQELLTQRDIERIIFQAQEQLAIGPAQPIRLLGLGEVPRSSPLGVKPPENNGRDHRAEKRSAEQPPQINVHHYTTGRIEIEGAGRSQNIAPGLASRQGEWAELLSSSLAFFE